MRSNAIAALAAAALFAAPLARAGVDEDVRQLQGEWEQIKYRKPKAEQERAYQALSETAAAVLTRCNGQASLAHIIADLQQQFPDDDIAADVREFLEDAYAHGWVRLTRAG